jgi:low temperature requirement protein LtrA
MNVKLSWRRMSKAPDLEHRVTVLELFFDLVFVFAITQVTGFFAADLTMAGLGRGLMILAALWWAWVAYAWLTNTIHAAQPSARVTVFAAMAAMLIVSLAVPRAFGADARQFAVAYAVVRVLHVALYTIATAGDPHLRGAAIRLAPPLLVGSALLVGASFLDGKLRLSLWGVALAIDYAGPILAGARGWRVDAGHFVERHGLIVIIALGEAIVSIGVGAAGLPLDLGLIGAALLAVAIAGGLWWLYFDPIGLAIEHKLGGLDATPQAALARDAFSYIHLPMVAGIVLFALGVKKSIAHTTHPLPLVASIALWGGLSLYFLGLVLFRLRGLGTLSILRLLASLALAGGIFLGLRVPAIISLAIATTVTIVVILIETFARSRRG